MSGVNLSSVNLTGAQASFSTTFDGHHDRTWFRSKGAVIEEFSSITLGNSNVETDILGGVYEHLVTRFTDVTRQDKAVIACKPETAAKPADGNFEVVD